MRTLFLFTTIFLVSCQNPAGNPNLASAPYPMQLHTADSVPIAGRGTHLNCEQYCS